jgi:hypothetical protein
MQHAMKQHKSKSATPTHESSQSMKKVPTPHPTPVFTTHRVFVHFDLRLARLCTLGKEAHHKVASRFKVVHPASPKTKNTRTRLNSMRPTPCCLCGWVSSHQTPTPRIAIIEIANSTHRTGFSTASSDSSSNHMQRSAVLQPGKLRNSSKSSDFFLSQHDQYL